MLVRRRGRLFVHVEGEQARVSAPAQPCDLQPKARDGQSRAEAGPDDIDHWSQIMSATRAGPRLRAGLALVPEIGPSHHTSTRKRIGSVSGVKRRVRG